MKNTVITIALAAVLGLLAIGCHDEPVTPLPTVRNVDYIACGEQQRAAVGDDGWHALLDSLLSAAESGCHVTFWNPDAVGAKQADTITISTSDRREAYRWGEEMYDKGYVVSIIYDDATGTYRGTAVKSSGRRPTPTEHTFYPFDEYLPGTWRELSNHLGICVFFVRIHDANVGRDFYNFENITFEETMNHTYVRHKYDWGYDTLPIEYMKYLKITADSIYWIHANPYTPAYLEYFECINMPDLHAYGISPYYITAGDSMAVYQQPNMQPHNYDIFPEPMPILEWSWDTLLIRSTMSIMNTYYLVYVRDTMDIQTNYK